MSHYSDNLICISLMTNDIQGSFIYKLSVHIVLPETISDCFVLLIFCHPFYSVDTSPLGHVEYRYVLHGCMLPFHLFQGFFERTNVVI